MLSGMNTSGRVPSVVPSNPLGVTPTIVYGLPLMTIDCCRTPGSAPKRATHAV